MCLCSSPVDTSLLKLMIICALPPTDRKEVEEPFSPQSQAAYKERVELEPSELSDSKLVALRALGAVGLQIVHYSCQESKFRVEVIGATAGLCVELSSQEYFRLSQAMEAQLEAEPKVAKVINTRGENVTDIELSPAENTKIPTKGRRYLRKLLPMFRVKGRSVKESSQLQVRQRISMFMIRLLRLFEKKKRPAKAATSATESAQEVEEVEPIVAVSS